MMIIMIAGPLLSHEVAPMFAGFTIIHRPSEKARIAKHDRDRLAIIGV
jgi:hypothetical protein